MGVKNKTTSKTWKNRGLRLTVGRVEISKTEREKRNET